MTQVDVAVFHGGGIEVLASRVGEDLAEFASRVKQAAGARKGAVAAVDVIGPGAAVFDWLVRHGCRAVGVNRAMRGTLTPCAPGLEVLRVKAEGGDSGEPPPEGLYHIES